MSLVSKLRSIESERKIIILKNVPRFVSKIQIDDENIEIWDIKRHNYELIRS